MSQQNWDLAKKGEPQAIAALMNYHLQPKGINVRASLKDDCLRLVLESEQVPDEQAITAFIHESLAALGSSAIVRVKVFGQQIGDDIPVWSRDLELIGKPEADVSVRHAQPVEDAVDCPKCGSTQIMATKKGFGVGKAAVGAVLLGPIGLAGGMMGSNQIMLSCMKCGHQWKPGETTVTNKKPINHRVTSAKVKIMSLVERIATGVFAFIVFGFFGIVLLCIPIIGWIPGLLCLIGAIYCPFLSIFGDKDIISFLVGNCPHCGKEVKVSNIKAQYYDCCHCEQKFFIRGQKFHTI